MGRNAGSNQKERWRSGDLEEREVQYRL